MKIAGYLSVLTLLLITVWACSTSSGLEKTPAGSFADYKGWQKVNAETITGDMTGMLGGVHEGERGFREVYVNAIGAATSSGAAPLPYPEGTVLVKEAYEEKDGGKGPFAGLTVMVKRSGTYDPDNGNWEYLLLSPRGNVTMQGKVGMCIGCHAAAYNDSVFTDNRGE